MSTVENQVNKAMRNYVRLFGKPMTTSQSQPDLIDPAKDQIATNIAEKLGVTTMNETVTPKPKKQSSFVAVLCDLDVGGSAVRNHSPNADITLTQLAEELSEMKAMISNNVRPSVRIATEKTGFTYSVETSQTITSAGRVYVQVIVTRTA